MTSQKEDHLFSFTVSFVRNPILHLFLCQSCILHQVLDILRSQINFHRIHCMKWILVCPTQNCCFPLRILFIQLLSHSSRKPIRCSFHILGLTWLRQYRSIHIISSRLFNRPFNRKCFVRSFTKNISSIKISCRHPLFRHYVIF